MNIAIQNEHMFGAPKKWIRAHLEPSAREGYHRVAFPDGSVLSVQPDGLYETRPAGTDGPWEQGKLSGSVITYAPEDHVYSIVIVDV